MFDTMTMTKLLGGFCGAFLIFLLGGWAAETIYHSGGGHGDDHAQGYVVEVATADGAAEVEDLEPAVDFSVVLAAATAEEGEGVWRNCRACHALEEGKNGTGPSLYGVVGRPVDSISDFNYSGALEQVADVWTPENLNGFLENPSSYAPGTSMGFKGLSKVEDRASLIKYLDSIDG